MELSLKIKNPETTTEWRMTWMKKLKKMLFSNS